MRPAALLPLCLAACAAKEPAPLSVPLRWAPAALEAALRAGEQEVTVEISEGSITFADLRLHAPPETAARWQPADLLMGRAWAHPGHDPAGDVQLEALGTWTEAVPGPAPAEAEADAEELGTLSGLEGEIASASLRLSPDVAQRLAATLRSGELTLPVDVALTLDDPISGLPVAATLAADAPPDTISLRFDLAVALQPLLDSGPLDALDSDGDGVITEADTAADNSLRFGLLSPNSWSVTVDGAD